MQGASVEATRDATIEERIATLRDITRSFRRHLGRNRVYMAWRIGGGCGVLIVCALVVWMSGSVAAQDWLGEASLPVIIGMPLLALGTYLRIFYWQYRRAIVALQGNTQAMPWQFTVEGAELTCVSRGIHSRIAISAITDIVDNRDRLIIYLSATHPITLTKAAFDSQRLENFRAELMRRWQASRAEGAS